MQLSGCCFLPRVLVRSVSTTYFTTAARMGPTRLITTNHHAGEVAVEEQYGLIMGRVPEEPVHSRQSCLSVTLTPAHPRTLSRTLAKCTNRLIVIVIADRGHTSPRKRG
jgi:hypothetical protein